MHDPVLQVKVSKGQEDIVRDIRVPGEFKQMLEPLPGIFQWLIKMVRYEEHITNFPLKSSKRILLWIFRRQHHGVFTILERLDDPVPCPSITGVSFSWHIEKMTGPNTSAITSTLSYFPLPLLCSPEIYSSISDPIWIVFSIKYIVFLSHWLAKSFHHNWFWIFKFFTKGTKLVITLPRS